MQKTPFQSVKERFTDKQGLVKALQELAIKELWIDRINDDKGLMRVSNRKLLHLYDVISRVKSDFGTRDKLIDELLSLQKRIKDGDYRTRLQTFGTPKLWELYQSAKKRAKAAAKIASA
jgi:hypothetical protein